MNWQLLFRMPFFCTEYKRANVSEENLSFTLQENKVPEWWSLITILHSKCFILIPQLF